MNTQQYIVEDLIKKYGYKPLPSDLRKKVRHYFNRKIPSFLNINGGGRLISKKSGILLCDNYDKIVVGDYGAFIEISTLCTKAIIPDSQKYRLEERYRYCKYLWLNPSEIDDTKIYFQKGLVPYADYLIDKYYVSVYDVINE